MSAECLENKRRQETAPAVETMLESTQDSEIERELGAGRNSDDVTKFDADEGKLEPRMSLWTVPEKWGGGFFFLLVSQGGMLIGLHTWRTLISMPNVHLVDTVLSEVLFATPILVFAGILSMIELEVALTLSQWYERRSIRKDKERYESGFRDGEKRGEKRGWEKGIEEGRRLEREKFMAELASQSNGDIADQH